MRDLVLYLYLYWVCRSTRGSTRAGCRWEKKRVWALRCAIGSCERVGGFAKGFELAPRRDAAAARPAASSREFDCDLQVAARSSAPLRRRGSSGPRSGSWCRTWCTAPCLLFSYTMERIYSIRKFSMKLIETIWEVRCKLNLRNIREKLLCWIKGWPRTLSKRFLGFFTR